MHLWGQIKAECNIIDLMRDDEWTKSLIIQLITRSSHYVILVIHSPQFEILVLSERSQDDDDLHPSCVWLALYANVDKVQHELLGVRVDSPQQQDFLRSLDVRSSSNEDAILCLQKRECILLRNEPKYCMQTVRSVKNPPNHHVDS